MTPPGPAGPRFCLDTILLPLALLAGALDMEPAATIDTVIESPVCILQGRHRGDHHGLVASERGDDAVWAVWGAAHAVHLVVLTDCPGVTTDGMDGCSLFAEHDGRHSFDLYDPWQAAARAMLARLPLIRHSA